MKLPLESILIPQSCQNAWAGNAPWPERIPERGVEEGDLVCFLDLRQGEPKVVPIAWALALVARSARLVTLRRRRGKQGRAGPSKFKCLDSAVFSSQVSERMKTGGADRLSEKKQSWSAEKRGSYSPMREFRPFKSVNSIDGTQKQDAFAVTRLQRRSTGVAVPAQH